MADSEYPTATQRATKDSLRQFLWNPEKREVLGRTRKRWGQLLLFYIIFYGALTALFAVSLQMFYLTRKTDRPTHNLYDDEQHPMLQVPGLGMRPRLIIKGTTPKIEFTSSDPDSYSEYVDGIKEYLAEDYTTDSVAVKTCAGENSGTCNSGSLGECDGVSDPSFGFSSGQPCILLKINRIIGWMPTYDTLQDNITISCEDDKTVKTSKDKDTCNDCVGTPEYFPSGIPVQCFPYCGVESSPDYYSPVVMVKFKGISVKGKWIRIACKANVKDFEHTSDGLRDNALSIRFSLKIQ